VLCCLRQVQGRSQKFVSEEDKTGGLGQKSPSGVQGQNPGGGLGAKPPEAEDRPIFANNHCNNVLTKKNPKNFFSMGISGVGDMSPLPPSPLPYAPGHSRTKFVGQHFGDEGIQYLMSRFEFKLSSYLRRVVLRSVMFVG